MNHRSPLSFSDFESPGGLPDGSPSDSIKIMMTTLYSISFLIGFVGNSLGLYIICRKCGVRAATHLLIANLACSNLLIVFIVMPMSVTFLYNEHRWLSGIAGTITCKLSQYFFLFPIALSILTILVVSIDRFFAVCYPLRGQVFRKPKIMTATIWICSAAVTSPTLAIFKVMSFSEGEWSCISYFGQDPQLAITLSKVYYTLIFVLLYLLPLFIIAILYALVGYKLYHRSVPGLSRAPSYRERVERSKQKVVKVMLLIVAAFALCWFPAHAMHYYVTFEGELYSRMPPYLFPLLLWISHTNSAIDPFLYILLSQNFRREFRKVINQCAFHEKKKRFNKRISRISSSLSRRNFDARRSGSNFWSLRRTDSYKVNKNGIPKDAQGNMHELNICNLSPEKHRPLQQNLQDHVL